MSAGLSSSAAFELSTALAQAVGKSKVSKKI